jgi:hypothetical protein
MSITVTRNVDDGAPTQKDGLDIAHIFSDSVEPVRRQRSSFSPKIFTAHENVFSAVQNLVPNCR